MNTIRDSLSLYPKKTGILSVGVIGTYLIYHLLTLSRSPMPWFDEVFFVSLTQSFMNNGTLSLDISPVYMTDIDEVLIYGPVYFWVQSIVLETFGLGIVQFRALNLISGILIIIVGNAILRLFGYEKKSVIAFTILLGLDPIFQQNMHSGRMDLWSVLLLFMSYFLYFSYKKRKINIYHVASAIFFTGALLSTPRVLFLGIPYIFFFLRDIYRSLYNKRYDTIGVWAMWVMVVFTGNLLWIYIKFGGFLGMGDYLGDLPVETSGFLIALQFVRQTYHWPLFAVYILALYLLNKNKSVIARDLFYLSIVAFLSFSIFVKEAGPYAAMVVPFQYIVVSTSLNYLKKDRFKYAVFGLLLFINLGITSFKALVIIGNWTDRNPAYVEDVIESNIPKGAKVLSEYEYYYAVSKNNNHFRAINLNPFGLDLSSNYYLNQDNIDYIIVKEATSTKDWFKKYYNPNSQTMELIKFRNNETNSFGRTVNQIINKLGIRTSSSFDGIIYKTNRGK